LLGSRVKLRTSSLREKCPRDVRRRTHTCAHQLRAPRPIDWLLQPHALPRRCRASRRSRPILARSRRRALRRAVHGGTPRAGDRDGAPQRRSSRARRTRPRRRGPTRVSIRSRLGRSRTAHRRGRRTARGSRPAASWSSASTRRLLRRPRERIHSTRAPSWRAPRGEAHEDVQPLSAVPRTRSIHSRGVKGFKRLLVVLGIAGAIGALARLRGKGEVAQTSGGWRELEGPDFR